MKISAKSILKTIAAMIAGAALLAVFSYIVVSRQITPEEKYAHERDGKLACIQALEQRNMKPGDNQILVHDPEATFDMNGSGDNPFEGVMQWESTVVMQGAPVAFPHTVTCLADTSVDPVNVTYLHAEMDL